MFVLLCLRCHQGPVRAHVLVSLVKGGPLWLAETYSVGDHGREDRPLGIVGIEVAYQEGHHGDLYQGDYGV